MSTFQFTSVPTQCMPLGVRIIGNGGGNPPYALDLVPTRSSPLHVTSIPFNGTSLTVPALALAAGEQFVAMVSDQRGVGSLGTSLPITVANSGTSDCLTASNSPVYFGFDVSSNATQCGTVTIRINSTYPSTLSPPAHVWFICPGSRSIAVDIPPGSVVPGTLSSFQWRVTIRGGTQFIMVVGDARVHVTSALPLYTMTSSNDTSCLGPDIPSLPAGQIVTDTPSKHSNAGAIAGGTIGGLACAAIVAIILYLLLRYHRRQRHLQLQHPRHELDPEPISYSYPAHLTPPAGESHHMTSHGLVGLPQPVPAGKDYLHQADYSATPPAYSSVE